MRWDSEHLPPPQGVLLDASTGHREPWESRRLQHRSIKWLLQFEKIQTLWVLTSWAFTSSSLGSRQSVDICTVIVWGGSCSGPSPWRLYLWRPHCPVHLNAEKLLGKPLRYPQLGRPCGPLAREGEWHFLSPYKVSGSVPSAFHCLCVSKVSSVLAQSGPDLPPSREFRRLYLKLQRCRWYLLIYLLLPWKVSREPKVIRANGQMTPANRDMPEIGALVGGQTAILY